MDHPEAYRFLRKLADWDGCADRWNLGPQTSQAENSARQYCKRHGWATFEGGYWRLTDAGCAQINWTRPERATLTRA